MCKILISTQVPTAAAARAACGSRRLCSAAELRRAEGVVAWADGDCASCFSHIASCDVRKERWGADHFPLVYSSGDATRLECLEHAPRKARACCCGPE